MWQNLYSIEFCSFNDLSIRRASPISTDKVSLSSLVELSPYFQELCVEMTTEVMIKMLNQCLLYLDYILLKLSLYKGSKFDLLSAISKNNE